MNLFGWVLIAFFALAAINDKSATGGRVLCLAFIIGILTIGTGVGL